MGREDTTDFELLIAGVARALTLRSIPYMLIGGQAVLLHGEPRLTQDVDVTLGVDPEALPALLAACESLGLRPLPENVESFVRRTFVLPVADDSTGIRVDFIFSTTLYEQQAIGRSVKVILAGISVAFASAEDLILHKLFAGRPRDLEDAVGVVHRKGVHLDWSYMERWASEFARIPEREHLPDQLHELRRRSGS